MQTTAETERISIDADSSQSEHLELIPRESLTIKQENDDENETKPLKIVGCIVNHPCKMICTILLLSIIIIYIDSMVFIMFSPSGREWFVTDTINTHKFDAINTAKKELEKARQAMTTTSLKPKTELVSDNGIITVFKTRNGDNILQPKYLPFIQETNNKIINTDINEYSKLCYADSRSYPNCSSQSYYDPLIDGIINAGFNINNITNEQLTFVIKSLIDNLGENFYMTLQESFISESLSNNNSYKSEYYRSIFKFGSPYPDINDTFSSPKASSSKKYYIPWITPIWKDIQMENNDDSNIEIVMAGKRIYSLAFKILAQNDNKWIGLSVIFVWFILLIHMKSLFLSTCAMIQIIIGFPISYFFYRFVFQVIYFDVLSFVVIFNVLGIAADDCFVFMDAWSQSKHVFSLNKKNLVTERMSYTYKRAGYAMFVTTFTTAISFFATSFSPLIPISAFGIWAGIVITINYLLMLTFFPACVSWYVQYIEKYEKCPGCCYHTSQETENIKRQSIVQIVSSNVGSSIERFLRDTYSKFIYRFRMFIILIFTLFIAFSAWQSSKLKPLSEQEKYFPDEHFMEKMNGYQQHFFGGDANSLNNPQIIWGVHPKMDRSDSNEWDIDDLGKVEYDQQFDLSTTEAQQFIFDICEKLLNDTEYKKRLYFPENELKCFIYDMIDYAKHTKSMSFPLEFSSDDAIEQHYQFNSFINDWTTNDPKGKMWLNNGDIGYFADENELKYIKINYKLNIHRFAGYDIKMKEFKYWESEIKKWNNNPLSPSNAFQASGGWAWMSSERSFFSGAIQGIMISLPAAFIVLLLSTRNWILSIFAILSITGIILSEVMLMVLQGWECGVSESIAIVIMIGFSVDYVVHFACAYIECPYSKERKSRIEYSLYSMGISIIYGSISTFGAGVFLIFAQLLIYYKFSILVMSIEVMSIFYSFGFFMALLAVFGPIGDKGKISCWK